MTAVGSLAKARIRASWPELYARLALSAAFLSAVAARFGFWHGRFDMSYFDHFVKYTAEVNSFLPSSWSRFIAWTATILETALAIALIAGLGRRWTPWFAAGLLFLFGTAMAISFGPQSPMDYSVFSASAAASLLGYRAGKEFN